MPFCERGVKKPNLLIHKFYEINLAYLVISKDTRIED